MGASLGATGNLFGYRNTGWRYVQLVFRYTQTTNTTVDVVIGESGTGGSKLAECQYSGWALRKCYYSEAKKLWGGNVVLDNNKKDRNHQVFVSPDFNFNDGEMDGCPIIIGTGSYPQESDFRGYVVGTGKRALNVLGGGGSNIGIPPSTPTWKVWIARDYLWYKLNGEDKARIEILDRGLSLGATFPLAGTSSLKTNYKYSKVLNGRNFIANIRIENDREEQEDHTDWIMYSEVNQPDVIPISNYIQTEDIQGGDIVGLEVLMSDLVVFMERGIFRLSVPGTNPSGWSLVEAYPNIGSLNHLGIVKTDFGIVFCSNSGIYLIDSSFSLKPLHMPIKSKYDANLSALGTAAELVGTKLGWNEKDKKLYVMYAYNKTDVSNVYDFKTETWAEIQPTLGGPSFINQVVQNHELTPYFHISSDDGTGGAFYKPHSSSTEGVTTIMETGLQKISEDPTRKANIRKVVADVTNPQHASEPITMTVSGGNSISGATLKVLLRELKKLV